VAHRPSTDLIEIPPYPHRPNNENSNNILALGDVKNFVYLSDPAAFGRQDQFALKIHDTNFDLIIVDPFSGRDPLSKAAVETLKYKKLGARRLVFARMDIGTVASYRYYWQDGWREGNPSWIANPYPGDPDRYFIEYWDPAWKDLMYGNPQSYLYGLITQGYDGVILEGMRSYLVFEGNVEVEQEFAPLAAAAN
jgi:cysteinyl-tRNA synthetase, unknown class